MLNTHIISIPCEGSVCMPENKGKLSTITNNINPENDLSMSVVEKQESAYPTVEMVINNEVTKPENAFNKDPNIE
jgi:hypothetical protein